MRRVFRKLSLRAYVYARMTRTHVQVEGVYGRPASSASPRMQKRAGYTRNFHFAFLKMKWALSNYKSRNEDCTVTSPPDSRAGNCCVSAGHTWRIAGASRLLGFVPAPLF